MIRRPPRSTRTDTLFPYTTLFRSRPSAMATFWWMFVIVARDREMSSATPVTRLPSSAASAVSRRSEEHTSELQSLMRISYAVFCLKKKKQKHHITKQVIHVHSPTTRESANTNHTHTLTKTY